MGKTGLFPALNEFLKDTANVPLDDNVKSKIIYNLQSFCCEFAKHFSDITKDDLAFIKNLCLVTETDLVSMFNKDNNTETKLIALKNNSTMQDAFKDNTLSGQQWHLHIPELQAQQFDC